MIKHTLGARDETRDDPLDLRLESGRQMDMPERQNLADGHAR